MLRKGGKYQDAERLTLAQKLILMLGLKDKPRYQGLEEDLPLCYDETLRLIMQKDDAFNHLQMQNLADSSG